MMKNSNAIKKHIAFILSALLLCGIFAVFAPSYIGAGEITGTFGTYDSSAIADPDTRDLSKFFSDNLGTVVPDFDGRIAVDKSVFYKFDPQGANSSFSEGDFNIVLSALGQSFYITETTPGTESSSADVVFVIDISGSMMYDMDDGDGGTISRAEASVNAVNLAIRSLYESNSNVRVGVITFSSSASTLLPLDKYTIAEGYSDFLLFEKKVSISNILDETTRRNVSADSEGYYYLLDGQEYPYVVKNGNKTYLYTSSNNRTRIFNGSSSYDFTYNGIKYNITRPDNSTVTIAEYKEGLAETSANRNTIYTSGALKNSSGSFVSTNNKAVTGGTYTQSGISAAASMLANTSDKTHRIPAIILLTDGLATYGNEDHIDLYYYDKYGDGSESQYNSTMASIAYDTVQTLVYEKARISALYGTSGKVFTLGPGITSLFGKTMLDPSAANITLCLAEDTTSREYYLATYLSTVADDLLESDYGDNFTTGSTAYADFADFSIAGALTANELENAFSTIISQINVAARPGTSASTTQQVTEFGDGDYAVKFFDTLGAGFSVNGAPAVIYNGSVYTSDSNSYSVDADGTERNVYSYSSQVTDPTTGTRISLSTLYIAILTDSSGIQKVEWFIPSNLLPINTRVVASNSDSYNTSNPIRLSYKVSLDANATAGTYYTNARTQVTGMFLPTSRNPYYYDSEGNIKEITSPTINKTTNATDTDAYVENESISNVGVVSIMLGNNGKIVLEGDDPTQTGKIVIKKSVVNGIDSSKRFIITVSNASCSFSVLLTDGETTSVTVPVGTYTVTETVPAGYSLTSVLVDGTASYSVTVTDSATVTVALTNTYTPSHYYKQSGGIENIIPGSEVNP